MSESFIYDLNYETWLDSVMNGSVSIGFVSVHLNTDTVPMSATDGFGTYVEPNASIGYTPFVGPFWSITNSGGDATATTTEVFWELAVPAGHHDSISITGWWAQDDATETLICGGSVSPPIVVHGSSATAIVVSPITLTLGNCSPGGGAQYLKVYDDLLGTGPLASHTPEIGGLYTISGGTWTVDNGSVSTTAGGNLAYIDSGISDGIISGGTSFFFSGGQDPVPGLAFRIQDANNYWLAYMNANVNQLSLANFVAGTFVPVQNATVAIASSDSFAMTVILKGPNILVTVNGGLGTCSTTSSYLETQTKHGLRCDASGVGTAVIMLPWLVAPLI